jgi:small basic protein (TIGR04137 family)
MSLHRSLKTKPTGLNQHRNVLTRAERIAKLSEGQLFQKEKNSPLGVGKVISRLMVTKKPKKEEGEGEEGAAAATAAPAKGAAPAGKAAAPAKGAAPAAKPPGKK